MSSAGAWVAALALLCVAVAVLLWQRGARSQGEASAARFIESRIAPVMSAGPAPGRPASPAGGGASAAAVAAAGPALRAAPAGVSSARPAAAQAGAGTPAGAGARAAPRKPADTQPAARIALAFDNLATRAGLGGARTLALASLLAMVLICAWVALDAGALAAAATGVACASAACLFISVRTQRRRFAIVQQMPTFLDGIVRLVTLGNSVPAAFQAALQTTEAPLRECMDRASRGMRAGVEVDRALSQVGAVYGIREFDFVGSVLRLSVKYGGRADVMLERMSVFMRDLEQAERELSAMSAETRLSAWVLAVLPLLIGGFLIATNPTYFSAMWADPSGRKLVYVAFGMQMLGGYLLHRLTRLRS